MSFRNSLADYQTLTGGNRIDYNLDPRVHEVPEFYCLDPDFWHPDLDDPGQLSPASSRSTVKIYHAVGNVQARSEAERTRNLKSTHIYIAADRTTSSGRDTTSS